MTVRKILHAADIHLDSPMQNLEAYPDAPVDEFRGATRVALANLVDFAIQQRVDLVLIAGDLYDGDWADAHTGLYFIGQAARLREAGIPIVVIRGNHDAALLMSQTLRLPDNPDGSAIMLDHQQVDQRRFEDLGIVVHGRSFAVREVTEDLSRDYPPPISGWFNLGLLHTCLTGSERHGAYAPTTPEKLHHKGYDYWALGHIHARRDCHQADQTPIVFSGNTQGRHIRETGPKGCYLLQIDSSHRVTSTFHALDATRWAVMHVDGSEIADPEDLLDDFQPWLEQQLRQAAPRPLAVRVRVSGQTPIRDTWLRAAAHLENQLRAIALQCGPGRVWIEQLRLRLSQRRSVGSPLDDAASDGPYASLRAVLTQFQQDPASQQALLESLKPLWNRLPLQLTGDPQDPFSLDSPEPWQRWLDGIEPELNHRLQQWEEGQ